MSVQSWEEISLEQQAIRDAAIPKEWILKDLPAESALDVMEVPYKSGIMTQRELEITEQDATSLLEQMACGSLTSYEVTLAFCKRAAIAQQVVSVAT